MPALGVRRKRFRVGEGARGVRCKTRSARLRRAIQSVTDWCRRHRHEPVKVQHDALRRRIQGHFNYYGVNGNMRSLWVFVTAAARAWVKWLRRRRNRTRLTWERFLALLARFPLPRPRVAVWIWAS